MTGDPRELLRPEVENILPVVALPASGVSLGVIAGGAAVAAVILFGVLDSHRRTAALPPEVIAIDRGNALGPPPPLEIPSAKGGDGVSNTQYYAEPPVLLKSGPPAWVRPNAYVSLPPSASSNFVRSPGAPALSTRPVAQTYAASIPPPTGASYVPAEPQSPNAMTDPSTGSGRDSHSARPQRTSSDRAHATMFEHPSSTIMQGTLIPAVLETGFDSSVPGFARAIVSRNIAGFDGSRIVVPRGSHLIGEYQTESGPGQRRALIIWSRLVRPDGATIELGSPTTDPVGRGGVEAHVNRHFLQRFMSAVLQTAVNIGSAVTGRSSSTAIVIAGPNVAGNAAQLTQSDTIAPTLRVKPGTSVSVFVSRDLDFSDVDDR